ncbi:hypothetical protein COW95_04455 [Candidatus Peregrinibacteria bacterium CG22_combo_CG10-13_8_21_14_all_49_11]|nr:MAG: hypothetical protein COW95_04455 [Candidatus Peregrinibacteria bacterium CG22_combo_CG10-13_8_21_14_all_49_11]
MSTTEVPKITESLEGTRNDELERIRYEQSALRAMYQDIFTIEEVNEDVFRVLLPGTSKDFSSWDEALDYLRTTLIQETIQNQKSLLSLPIAFPHAEVQFVPLHDVSNTPIPLEDTHAINHKILSILAPSIRKQTSATQTYDNSVRNREMHREGPLYQFIQEYLQSEPGQKLLHHLHIPSVRSLTPKQAMELATEIVLRHAKYNTNLRAIDSRIDKGTVLDMLEEGRDNIHNPQWEGNGVCRNFAGGVQAVFNTLKSNQTEPFNPLKNTHCLYVSGIDHVTKKHHLRNPKTSHAWNIFLTALQHAETEHTSITVSDITQELHRRNERPDTKPLLDLTALRSVNIITRLLAYEKLEPEFLTRAVDHVLQQCISGTAMGSTLQEKEHFFLSQALWLLQVQKQYADIPHTLAEKLFHLSMPHGAEIDSKEKNALQELAKTHGLQELYNKLFPHPMAARLQVLSGTKGENT